MRLFSFVLAVSGFMAVPALGEVYVGNGGDVLSCEDGSVELLDFYEARQIFGFQRDLGEPSLTRDQKVTLILDRLARLDPDRAQRYRNWAATFTSESLFLPDVVLTDVNDSGHTALPRGCAVEQIAIQRTPTFPGSKRYTISQDLWDRLDSDNQAGLVLHEIIYREAMEHAHSDSIATRYLNGLLTSELLVEVTLADYVESLRGAKMSVVTINGVALLLWPMTFHENGKLASGYLSATVEFPTQNPLYKVTIGLRIPSEETTGRNRVFFHDDGTFRAGCIPDRTTAIPTRDGRFEFVGRFTWVEMDQDGYFVRKDERLCAAVYRH